MKDLKELRQEIDHIDRQLVDLFLRRMEVSRNVAAYKIANQIPVLDPERERQVLEAKAAMVDTPEMKADVNKLFETIMSMSRAHQRSIMQEREPDPPGFFRQYRTIYPPIENPRVVYQGMPGAYSEEAAVNFFGPQVNSQGQNWFEDSFRALAEGAADYAVLPIENSTTGSIRQVCDLLTEYQFYMVGETTVKVEHCLMALPGTRLEEITHVYSHEQGLFQSDRFLDSHPDWVRIPLLDTAGSAKFVAESGDRTKAAICSRRAAKVYGLEILVEGTNHNGENYTRFAVISRRPELRPGSDKITAIFNLPHQSGSLHEILTIFAVNGLNLVKLESRPMPGRKWEYMFFVEFTGNLHAPGMDAILRELDQSTDQFRVLGNYKANLAQHDAV
ncbi:MAG: chorismate mutase [Oscillospiraceae bacterium]|nr:chorismate mutase [Oscillospiraceae bacterium]